MDGTAWKSDGHCARSAADRVGNELDSGWAGGIDTRIPMGRGVTFTAIMQGKPCRIMACSFGSAVPIAAEREAGTSGRTFR